MQQTWVRLQKRIMITNSIIRAATLSIIGTVTITILSCEKKVLEILLTIINKATI